MSEEDVHLLSSHSDVMNQDHSFLGSSQDPYESASFFSRLTFWYLNPFVREMNQKVVMQKEDVPLLGDSYSARHNAARFEGEWDWDSGFDCDYGLCQGKKGCYFMCLRGCFGRISFLGCY